MYNATAQNTTATASRSIQIGAGAALPAQTLNMTGAQQNDLLRALSRDELMQLFEHLEFVPLPCGKRLYDCGEKIEYTYFPTNAIVSLQYVMEDGATTEIAVVGREGVIGVALYAGERANCCAVVQGAGYGYRLKTDALRLLFAEGGTLAQQLMRYTSSLFAQLAQNVVGSRHSSIEQKLCCWLLDRLDRSTSNELKVTQETIAQMLGVRRESITGAAGKLQEEGILECRRGLIVVIDRPRLEQCAGNCYLAGRAAIAQNQLAGVRSN